MHAMGMSEEAGVFLIHLAPDGAMRMNREICDYGSFDPEATRLPAAPVGAGHHPAKGWGAAYPVTHSESRGLDQ
jgi:hypothetical protein